MIGSIAFVAVGVIVLATNPAANWLVATAGISFFGFCAAVFMLVARRRSLGSITALRPWSTTNCPDAVITVGSSRRYRHVCFWDVIIFCWHEAAEHGFPQVGREWG
jgi:hypothetical protein